MLTKCPECGLPVSDKAISCPHCGYPMKNDKKKSARKKPKRRRLPNGFGQISELKGQNLRKPFRAMVTIGKTDEGKPICKLLQPQAYFETYNDAYQALMKYNKDPYIFTNNITVGELYGKWSEQHFRIISKGAAANINAAWKYCDTVKNIKLVDLRARHIKYCMDEGCYEVAGKTKYPTPNMKNVIKVMFNQMLDYAIEYEMIDKNYARNFSVSKEDRKKMEENRERHIPYSDEEIKKLWENINTIEIVDVILIQCYTGWRPKELEIMKLSDVDLELGIMRGGVKTKAGKNRIVPIHSKIYELVRKRCEDSRSKGSEYFITMVKKNGGGIRPFNYEYFQSRMNLVKEALALNTNHRPHDGRAHFITQAKKYHMDEYAIKRIVGHEIKDLTEDVYTTRNIEWLKEEIEKIK
ncbi:MAG: tyrosine-type recombinase/integrase [Lachnospiraceae bacterium]|nr:tyrosine-type recombinase/integrase [Lachnospiraceae bacterium]